MVHSVSTVRTTCLRKKTFILFTATVLAVFLFLGEMVQAQVTTVWEKSSTLGTRPNWFGTDTERGFAYGNVNTNDRIYVVSRKSASDIIILNAATGDSVDKLDITGVTGGTFALNDVEVSSDGIIFACNVVTSSSASTPFKIYKWTSEAAAPVVAATFETGSYRLGDKFTVTGSVSDNSIAIYAVVASNNKFIKFTTTDNGVTFTPEEITVTGLASGSVPQLIPSGNGYWINGGGQNLRQIDAANTIVGTVDLNIVPSNSNALRFITAGGRNYVINYVNGNATTTTSSTAFFERAFILDVTDGYTNVLNLGATPILGTNSNTNAAGDIAIKDNGDGTFIAYVLSANQGLGAYDVDPAGLSATLSAPTSAETFAGFWPPANWRRYSGHLTDNSTLTSVAATWVPDDFANVTSPINRSARVNIYGTSLRHWLVSPTIDLGAGTENYQLEFDIALTLYGNTGAATLGVDDTLAVVISTDNGVTWSSNNIIKLYNNSTPISNGAGDHAAVNLTGYTGLVKLAFYAASSVSNVDNDLFIDNVIIDEAATIPVISLAPSALNFGNVYTGFSKSLNLTVSNNGGSDLTVNITPPANITLSTSNFTVLPGSSEIVNVTYSPTNAGVFEDSLLITSNDPNYTSFYFQLTGNAFDPYTEISEDFNSTASGNLPPNWTGTVAPFVVNTSNGIDGSHRLTKNLWSSLPNSDFILPLVSISNQTVLKFFYRVVNYSSYPSTPTPAENFRIIISVSTDLGLTYTPLDTIGAGNHTPSLSYVEKMYNLGAYDGQNTLIRFYGSYLTGDFYADFDNFFIGTPPSSIVDWCNLQFPASATITAGDEATVYAQAWIDGVTNIPGATPDLLSWIGISSTNTHPDSWSNWMPAAFNTDVGNNDEFMTDIGAGLAPGTYYYASRFQYEGGPYSYGGYSTDGGGFWNGTTYISGELTVEEYVVTTFPYNEGFESTTFPPAGWAREDLNAGNTWQRATAAPFSGTGHARYAYNSTIPANDWLITPGLILDAAKTYRITYNYRAQSSTYPERLKISVGDEQNAAAMDSVLFDHPNVINTSYLNNSILFSPDVSGTYYVGFNAYSLADMYYLDLDDITISEVLDVDYAVTSLFQVDGIPTPFNLDVITTVENGKNVKEAETYSNSSSSSFSSNVNKSKMMNVFGSDIYGNAIEAVNPVSLSAVVKNVGLQSLSYNLEWSVAGINGTPVSRPGINPDGVDTVSFGTIPLERGTFTSVATAVVTGDGDSTNNTRSYIRTLVYPDSMIRLKYDNGQNIQNTFIGYGTNNLPVTAGVRFTASEDMQLANIDALYRSENNSDSVLVRVWAAGDTTTAPGELLYSKKFAGENYIVPGEGGAYITLPLGEDAPAFLSGSDFWVSITFSSEIQYPMGAHNSPLTTPGRSFISGDDGLSWSPLIITTERAWLLRVVGIPYEEPIPPYLSLWERSDANGTLPSWFGATTERGLSYGLTSDGTETNNPRLFVVSRSSGIAVKILNADTGADVGDLNTTNITGGLLPLNDVGVTIDGKILACNVAQANDFKVYLWENETSVPVVALTYNSTNRIGDKFTVVGNYGAGTAQIWAASATTGAPIVYKWSMTGGVFNPTPEVITLSDNVAGGIASASVGPLPNGEFYWNATGQNARKYQADGTLIGIIPTLVVPTGSNAIRYLGTEGPIEYVATYAFGTGNENLRIIEVPVLNPADAVLYGATPVLGTNSAGGNGDVSFKINSDYTANVFVLSANNGLGAYRTSSTVPVELSNFTVNVADRSVTLNWSTASEVNSMGFEIERKLSDGFLWQQVGLVEAAGNTTQVQNYSYVDSKLESGSYEYRLKMVDFDGSFSYSKIVEAEIGTPMTFALSQNYPNPFNPTTRIDYQVPFNANVQIELYSITGERVTALVNTELSAGYYTVDINAGALRLASGVYFYRMIATDLQGSKFVDTKKMVLLK